jgi:hypothetical protein
MEIENNIRKVKAKLSCLNWFKKYPWKRVYYSINSRCKNKKTLYFKNNIKRRITIEEIKKLWFRDKAFTMESPSIDRINSDGDYEYQNCRFIEKRENCAKKKYTYPEFSPIWKPIVQKSKDGDILRKFKNISVASKETGVGYTSISNCANNLSKTAGGFAWEFTSKN